MSSSLKSVALPVEMVLHILEELCDYDVTEALKVAVVSHLFNHLAIRFIYGTVILTENVRWESFWETISLDVRATGRLACQVRNLAIAIESSPTSDQQRNPTFFANVFRSLPNLKNLYTTIPILSQYVKVENQKTIRLTCPNTPYQVHPWQHDIPAVESSLCRTLTHAHLVLTHNDVESFHISGQSFNDYASLTHLAFETPAALRTLEHLGHFPEHLEHIVLVMSAAGISIGNKRKKRFREIFARLHREQPRIHLAWNGKMPMLYDWEHDMLNGEDIWQRSVCETAEFIAEDLVEA